MKIGLDIKIKSPVLVVPETPRSSHALVGHLGNLSIISSFDTEGGIESPDGRAMVTAPLMMYVTTRLTSVQISRWSFLLYFLFEIHWTSNETYHFFRLMLIKMNHIWTLISYSSPHEAHLKIQRVAFVKKEKNEVKHERSFFENRRNCSPSELHGGSLYSEHSIALHSISMAGYATTVPAFVCFRLPAREASSFCDFWKLTSCDFTAFFSLLTEVHVNLYFFLDVLLEDTFS